MSAVEELRALTRLRPLQLLALAILLAGMGWYCFTLKFSVLDLDLWWHLKVGDWVVQHMAVPHTGILSRTAANRPWVAYSWGYEVLLSRAYAWFGLLGIGLYGTLLTLSVAFSVFWMLRRLSGRFWTACLLAVAGCYAFLFDIMPRPVFFSMILFCVTLTLILKANRSGRVQTLYWLPLIFFFWSNLHIQFIYGLIALALLLGANLLQRLAAHFGAGPGFLAAPALPAGGLALVFAACVLTTLIGPYSYHLYGVIVGYSRSKLPYATIMELQALSFRTPSNYVELLLAAAAFLAVGWQRKVDLFKLALLVAACLVAFRTMRDAWFLCLTAMAFIADVPLGESRREPQEKPLELAGVFAVVAFVLLLFARATDFTARGLDRVVSGMFPVNAVNFLRQNPPPGHLYNTFDWGGFLTWYMPQYPVSIDGRTDLYGDEMETVAFETESGDLSYKTDPVLNESGTVLLRNGDGLVSALDQDPRFRRLYQDAIATVFVRQAP